MRKAFLFDYDDTLVKTRESRFSAIKELGFRFYDYKIEDSNILPHWGKPFNELFYEIFNSQDQDIGRVISRYKEVTLDFPMTAYPDALTVIEELVNNAHLGIVTACSKDMLIPDLKMLKFPIEKFTIIQSAEDTEFHKPNPRVFDPALAKLEKLSISKNNISYIGDSIRDFEAAKQAGLNFVGILRGTSSKEEFDAVGATTITSLLELKNSF